MHIANTSSKAAARNPIDSGEARYLPCAGEERTQRRRRGRALRRAGRGALACRERVSARLEEVSAGSVQDRSKQGGDHAQSDEQVSPRAPAPNCSANVIRRSALRIQRQGAAGVSIQESTPNVTTVGVLLMFHFRRSRNRTGRGSAYVSRPHIRGPHSAEP
jgi:hypothetical protein